MSGGSIAELAAALQSLNATVQALNSSLTDTRTIDVPGARDLNTGFTLTSAYLVFFMQAGFAMLSAGSVRSKNAKNIILLNLLDACFGCLAWYITGYAFAWGDPLPNADGTFPYLTPFIGHKYFAQAGLPRSLYAHWFFQFTFAATSATIVSGAVAERCRFECYVCYNLMLVSFVYPVVAHWVWSPFGWLSAYRTPQTSGGGYTLLFGSGGYDFAGDGPVHMVGGLASLVAAKILGPRMGRFDAAGTPVDMPGHNASLTLLGVFLLWFGWYGFNPGSTNAILGIPGVNGKVLGFSEVAAAAAVNTTISAAAATTSTLLVAMLHTYVTLRVVVWDLIIAGNGALGGLVAITGGAAFVDTWAALIIGFVGGIVYYAASKINLLVLRIDDPLDAIAVHAGCGMWGLVATAAFATPSMVNTWFGPVPGTLPPEDRPYGFIMGGDGRLLAAQLIYILCTAAWVLGIMTPFFWALNRMGLMRVPPEVEVAGLDVSYHGGSSYPHEHKPNVVEVAPELTVFMTRTEVERFVHDAMDALEARTANLGPLGLAHVPSDSGKAPNLESLPEDESWDGEGGREGGKEEAPQEPEGSSVLRAARRLSDVRRKVQRVYSGGDSQEAP